MMHHVLLEGNRSRGALTAGVPVEHSGRVSKRGARVRTWMAVGLGGALGSMARHGVNHLVHAAGGMGRFPAATLVVNLAGCFAIGVLAGLLASGRIALRYEWREFVFVGVLGGFTTFSTFGLDTFVLARTGASAQAAANVFAQVLGGLLVLWLGYRAGS
jgi:fluoride exporter